MKASHLPSFPPCYVLYPFSPPGVHCLHAESSSPKQPFPSAYLFSHFAFLLKSPKLPFQSSFLTNDLLPTPLGKLKQSEKVFHGVLKPEQPKSPPSVNENTLTLLLPKPNASACALDPICSLLFKNITSGTSLVIQWLRICLPRPGTQVGSLVWENLTCCRATKPVHHDY